MAYENLTGFTEVDPSNHWSQTTTRNSVSTISSYETSYVYKDYTADYFGNYNIDFDFYIPNQASSSALQGFFAITDTIGEHNTLRTAPATSQTFLLNRVGGSYRFYLESQTSITRYSDYSVIPQVNTQYYAKMTREGTTVTCKIYPTSLDRTNDTNIVVTLTATCATTRLNYMQVGYSVNGIGAISSGGYTENVLIQYANKPDVDEADTLTLTDEISLRLIVEIEESLGLEDVTTSVREQFLEDGLNLSDELEANVNLEKYQPDIILPLTDEIIAGYVELKDLDNDFRSVIQEIDDVDNKINISAQIIEDVDNKFSTVKEELDDILQKINTAELELDDVRMAFHSAYLADLSDVDNKINTRARSLNDITNDFRMRLSWQVAGDLGIQSLGKEYLKVYFDNVEITDVDIDSIKISKKTGTSHTSNFDLERAYDDTRPDLEATVLIKYNDIIIYKGYITSIAPTDTPEKIQINCKDKYWLDNRNKVWFDIGHQPSDDAELYYYTISEGLSSLGIGFGIGTFIPQAMGLFGTGRSDAISAMVQNCGNFDWYYDENDNKRLWTANGGSIINIEPQELDSNLELYQVLSHDMTESAEDVENKLRVQMGDQIIRHPGSQGETRTYTSRIIGVSRVRAVPMWSSGQEIFSRNAGKGFDYHPESSAYADVFKKFKIINPTLDSWTDYKPPVVEITRPFGAGISVPSAKDGVLKEGFSVDFKEGILTLSDPLYYWTTDSSGKIKKLYSPIVTLIVYRQTYVTRTETDADTPEIDITNDLMFFTDKIGTYPTTILGTLNLTGLSIQNGGTYSSHTSDSTLVYDSTPSWNDTNFAHDMAYWKLSETADKKLEGKIKITLDASIFYGITLNKRIMVDGMLDSPLNITSLTYNMNDFTVDIEVESFRYFQRTVSIPSHGEGMTTTSIKTIASST